MSMVLDGARFACARPACWVYVLKHGCMMREAQCNVQPVFTTLLKLTLHDRIASNHHAQSQRRPKRSIAASAPSGAGGTSAAFTVAAGRLRPYSNTRILAGAYAHENTNGPTLLARPWGPQTRFAQALARRLGPLRCVNTTRTACVPSVFLIAALLCCGRAVLGQFVVMAAWPTKKRKHEVMSKLVAR